MPTVFVPPFRSYYYIYNGKYFSTLADVPLNLSPATTCQTNPYYLPSGWVLAPDNADSARAISSNSWSTSTVVVSSGVGYYSASTYGSINKAYSSWLVTGGSKTTGYTYNCIKCPCQVLITYSPPSPTSQPVKSTSAKKMSGGIIGAIVGPVLFFLAMAAAGYYFFKKRQNKPTPTQQVNIMLSI